MADAGDAISDEIALLESMYPDDVVFDAKSSHLKFKSPDGAGLLELRLSFGYPTSTLPEIIEASNRSKKDLRSDAKAIISRQQKGEPCLDAILTEFIELLQVCEDEMETETTSETHVHPDERADRTIIIWLHHLLATGKRKQALSPDCADSSQIRGLTKPGYPGVLIFSGPAAPVDAHVQALKHLRWQAFQIRYDGNELWSFRHGAGIMEVETMADVVADIDVIAAQRDVLLESLKIK